MGTHDDELDAGDVATIQVLPERVMGKVWRKAEMRKTMQGMNPQAITRLVQFVQSQPDLRMHCAEPLRDINTSRVLTPKQINAIILHWMPAWVAATAFNRKIGNAAGLRVEVPNVISSWNQIHYVSFLDGLDVPFRVEPGGSSDGSRWVDVYPTATSGGDPREFVPRGMDISLNVDDGLQNVSKLLMKTAGYRLPMLAGHDLNLGQVKENPRSSYARTNSDAVELTVVLYSPAGFSDVTVTASSEQEAVSMALDKYQRMIPYGPTPKVFGVYRSKVWASHQINGGRKADVPKYTTHVPGEPSMYTRDELEFMFGADPNWASEWSKNTIDSGEARDNPNRSPLRNTMPRRTVRHNPRIPSLQPFQRLDFEDNFPRLPLEVYSRQERLTGQSMDILPGVKLLEQRSITDVPQWVTFCDGREIIVLADAEGRTFYVYRSFAGTQGKTQHYWYPCGGTFAHNGRNVWIIKSGISRDHGMGRSLLTKFIDHINNFLPHNDAEVDQWLKSKFGFENPGWAAPDAYVTKPIFNLIGSQSREQVEKWKLWATETWKLIVVNPVWGKRDP